MSLCSRHYANCILKGTRIGPFEFHLSMLKTLASANPATGLTCPPHSKTCVMNFMTIITANSGNRKMM